MHWRIRLKWRHLKYKIMSNSSYYLNISTIEYLIMRKIVITLEDSQVLRFINIIDHKTSRTQHVILKLLKSIVEKSQEIYRFIILISKKIHGSETFRMVNSKLEKYRKLMKKVKSSVGLVVKVLGLAIGVFSFEGGQTAYLNQPQHVYVKQVENPYFEYKKSSLYTDSLTYNSSFNFTLISQLEGERTYPSNITLNYYNPPADHVQSETQLITSQCRVKKVHENFNLHICRITSRQNVVIYYRKYINESIFEPFGKGNDFSRLTKNYSEIWNYQNFETQNSIAELNDITVSNKELKICGVSADNENIELFIVFVLCSFAGGIFSKPGSDLYDLLKKLIKKKFNRNENEDKEKYLCIAYKIEKDGYLINVQIIMTNPKYEDIEHFIEKELKTLDKMLMHKLNSETGIKNIVIEYSSNNIKVLYMRFP